MQPTKKIIIHVKYWKQCKKKKVEKRDQKLTSFIAKKKLQYSLTLWFLLCFVVLSLCILYGGKLKDKLGLFFPYYLFANKCETKRPNIIKKHKQNTLD